MRFKFTASVIRILIFGLVLLLFFASLIFRLWDLQIRKGEEHRRKISRQSIRRIRHPASRGRIISSDMQVLADNIPSYQVVFHLAEMRQPGRRANTVEFIENAAEKIAGIIGRKNLLTKKDIVIHMNMRPGLPMTVFRSLNSEELSNITEMVPAIPGVEVVPVPTRFYPEGKTACHILGYVGRQDPKKAPDREEYFYYIPDQIGRKGLEKVYDTDFSEGPIPLRGLKGTPGKSMVRVDFQGFVYKTIKISEHAESGHDLILTINLKAQKCAEKLLEEKTGAIILMNAETGAVLALASAPGYDLTKFVSGISAKDWRELESDPLRPLVNRATSGSYPPGSIIKPLVAMAILENGFDANKEVLCEGAIRIGDARIRCWRRSGHGKTNLVDAIKQSCNVYFIDYGKKVGLEAIAKMLSKAGIGRPTGFTLPERKGLLPSRDAKRRIYGQSWNVFDTALLSIGQGIITITPLQAVVYAAAIANGGTLWRPYLLKELRDAQGTTLFVNKPEENGHLGVSQKNLDIVREGMWKVVNDDQGSAKKARNDYIELFGKTGTAQVKTANEKYNNTWFICFGRHKENLYAMVVFIKKGLSGGRTCAPIAGQFFNNWLGKEPVSQ